MGLLRLLTASCPRSAHAGSVPVGPREERKIYVSAIALEGRREVFGAFPLQPREGWKAEGQLLPGMRVPLQHVAVCRHCSTEGEERRWPGASDRTRQRDRKHRRVSTNAGPNFGSV